MGDFRYAPLVIFGLAMLSNVVELKTIDVHLLHGGVLHDADERFLSYALDCSLISHQWKTFNATNAKVVALTRALSPAILRLGGTVCDSVLFSPSEKSPSGNSVILHSNRTDTRYWMLCFW